MATSPTQPSQTLPQPLSYEQILGQELSSYASSLGINDLNIGAANTSFMQLVALMVARSSGDIFQILRDFSLDRATGPALQNLAIQDGINPLPAAVATSFIAVVDLSFQKIQTKIYAGANPPIAGSTTIFVSDASLFPASGAVFLGRTTVNVEGPLPYSSKTQVGSFWQLNLSGQTTKFHNIGESVILAQGGVRTVPANTIVVSPGIGTTPDIQYTVTQLGTILDGETTVSNVPVTALLPGSVANVPAGAISQFSGNPSGLSNASVTNPLPVTTGQDLETDNQLRTRVKNKLASTGLGTVVAIESALQGVQSPTSSDTIVSTDILNSSTNTTVYIDNGSGLEATHTGVAIETIVNSALGGEKFFQLVTGGKQTSVTKALLQSVAGEPFALFGGETLSVVVGNITYQHAFASTDFLNPGSATAYEVCASLNADTTLNYEAVTAGGGVFVVIRPEDQLINTIQVVSPPSDLQTDANAVLQFPSQRAKTLQLFKNGLLLTEDGTTASIFTQPQSLWSPTIANGDTLSISVDGTAPITYTLTDADFLAEGTYTTVSYSNSLQSWVDVLNNVITGITASIVGSTIEITSNLGAVSRAEITIVNTVSNPTSLIGKGFISNTDLSSSGVASDYILDRNTAQIELVDALVKNDVLSAGVLVTEANIKATTTPSGSVTLPTDAHVWISIDTDAVVIPTIMSGSTLTVSQVSPSTVRYTSNSSTSFQNVVPGDYVIIWSNEIPSSDRLEGRVHAVTGSTLDIKVTVAEYTAVTPVTNAAFIQGFVVIRTANVPQKFRIQAGTKTLYVIADELQTQTDELTFGVFDASNITVVTNTFDVVGQIVVATADTGGALIGFVGGTNSQSQDALLAFYETTASTSEFPLFFHSTISADNFAEPIDTYLTSVTSTLPVNSFDPNELVTFLNPYGVVISASGILTKESGIGDATITYSAYEVTTGVTNQYVFTITSASATAGAIYTVSGQNFKVTTTIVAATLLVALSAGLIDDEQPANETVQISAFSGANIITVLPEYPDVRRVRVGDRFYIANPLDFGYNDTVVAIVDNNAVGETYTLPLYRRAITNSGFAVNNYSFNAYDVDAGATASFATNFAPPSIPAQFDFSNFKALMQAKYVIQETPSQTALLFRSTPWGRSGEVVNIAYVYPTSANKPIASTVTTTDVVSIRISLASGNPIASTIAANTQWNVTITPNTPVTGTDQVTYTYNGTGTAPNLTLSGGEYVTILPSTGFDPRNTGTFRVSTTGGHTPTTISFSVPVPTGSAFAQSNVPTGVLNGITFYAASPTTAAQINTYVNSNLTQFITSTIVNDGGTSGSGVIAFSTAEQSGFTVQSFFLKDGINWIASSNVSGSPQFTFKEPLTYTNDTGYAFNMGEEVRLIPTTMDQVKDLWSILAVTGFTTVGTIEVVDRGTKIQLATNTIGSVGSIQIVGGNGNEYSVPVLTSGNLVGTTEMVVSANAIASQAMSSDQWFRLQAENFQNKDTGFSNNTSVTVLSNTPISGRSTVTLLNQQENQLYFGGPRNKIRVEGDTFRIEKQGSLACLSWNGVGTSPHFSANLNFNDSSGFTVNVSALGVYTIASGAANFAELSIGDIITTSGLVNPTNNGTFFVEGVNGTSFSVSNPKAVAETGTAITAGEFRATSSVTEGDTVTLSFPFAPLNQGEYRVVRRFNDSIWYENSNAVEEEILAAPNSFSFGGDLTTVYNVTVAGGVATLSWTGAGIQPTLNAALSGDIITFVSGFSSPNLGSFMVTNSGPSQQQIVNLNMPSGITFSNSGPGNYFELFNGGNANQYYVWFNVLGGSNTDPAPGGFTGIQVNVNASDTSSTVATETNAALSALVAMTTSVSGNVVTVVATVPTHTNSPVNVSMPVAFSFVVTQTGQTTFLTVINPAAVSQSGISGVIFTVNRPQIQFFPYEATVPGDKLVVNGTVLGAGNSGSYKVLQVLSPNAIIVSGTISQQFNTNLAGNSASLNIEEGTKYTGYKQVAFVSAQQGLANFNNITFNTPYQYEKIDLSAGVAMVSLGKLDFPTSVRVGIDSYNFDTGLIGEANRVVFGDPRDQITYPGYNAAGTDIYIREPLLRRVQIALAIRTQIGISFIQISNQIRSSVYALIQSNPLGQSIDLSSIVETVREIPGVISVVLTSPTYTVASDEIQLVTGEKAFIVSQVSDISISLIGS